VDIEVPRMRMQLRLNQFKAAKRTAKEARILTAFVRDAMVVRRAVALGLPVALLGQEAAGDNVVRDYEHLAEELLRNPPPA
jgi:chromosome partitioning protein